ncbi:hypothetical protein M8J77_012306 [Diaphorina citri]|nr:hypothetical protein M8J77_012306 [Diaphorina citri]
MGILTDSLLVDTIALILIVLFLLYKYYTKDYSHWKTLDISYLEPSFPFGNAYPNLVQGRPRHQFTQDLYKEFKSRKQPYGGYYVLNIPELIIVDPALLKNILISDFNTFPDRGFHNFELEKEPIVRHLFNLEGHYWKGLRQKLTPTFSSGKLKFMFETMKACSEDLTVYLERNLRETYSVDVKILCECYTLDVIGSCAFGLKVNCLQDPGSEFRKASLRLFRSSFGLTLKRALLRAAPHLSKFLNIRQVSPELTKYFTDLVQQNIEHREKNNIERADFLNLLLELKKKQEEQGLTEDKVAITLDCIVAQVFLFFIAGFHTSAYAMSRCLEELANNTNIQDKLRAEIREVTQNSGGEVTYANIKEMPYLDKVVKETLRKHPSLPQLNRRSVRPYTMPETGHTIKSRTRILVPVYAIHYDPEYYPNPEIFDPERFSPEQVAARTPFTYLPFGDGPRNCIGSRFGNLQLKLGLINVLSNYEFLPPSTPSEKKHNVGSILLSIDKLILRAKKLN